MSLFKRKPKQKSFSDSIEYFSNTAIKYAQSFDKEFDYSEDSVKDLEEILDWYSNDISESNPTDNQIWSMAKIFGVYLGQVIIKNCGNGYVWCDTDNSIPVIKKGELVIAPIDKVYKRLVYGPEDSVVSFYDVIVDNRF